MHIRAITRTGIIQGTIGITPEGIIGLDIGLPGPTIGITGGAFITGVRTVKLTQLSCQEPELTGHASNQLNFFHRQRL
jgi:hypothetical protein